MNGKQVAITRENGFREALKHDFNVFLLDFPKVNTILFFKKESYTIQHFAFLISHRFFGRCVGQIILDLT